MDNKKKKKPSNREVRTFTGDFEVRSDDDGNKKIIGYGARFNKESNEMGYWTRFVETIEHGAFDECLGDDVRALFNHDSNIVLGRTKSGTLKVSVDDFGLRYEITPPDTQSARDLMVSMERGDITQSSFAFTIEDDDVEFDEKRELYVRTIKKVKRLYDVSPVTYPAYEETDAMVRNIESLEELDKERTQERQRKIKLELELLENDS